MKTTTTVEHRVCDRCGAAKCICIPPDVLALWLAAMPMRPPEEHIDDPDLCERCIKRLIDLAKQIRTQRRRTWSEPGGAT